MCPYLVIWTGLSFETLIFYGAEMQDKVLELAIRRGFIYPSYEIYGGVGGFYDYAPLGAILKKKIEDKWRKIFCIEEGFYEIHCPTIAPEEVFIASGHVKNFVDPLVTCENCRESFRADHLIEESMNISASNMSYEEMSKLVKQISCPNCGKKAFGDVYSYNLMFKTAIGPGGKRTGYLRPETAQNIFILFNRLYEFSRKKLPFGITQIGKAYRNEISPRQGLIRLREFTQAELEYFFDPRNESIDRFKLYENEKLRLLTRENKEFEITAKEAVEKGILINEIFGYFLALTKRFLVEVGIDEKRIRFRQHLKEELAHYARDCWDAEVFTERYGYIEVVGIADRGDYDLKAHERHSNVEMKAIVSYEKPVTIKMKVFELNLKEIGKTFRKKAKEIIKELENADEKLIEEFEKKGFVKVCNEVLDSRFLKVKEVEKKVHGEKVVPHVIEPSFGIDRILYCVLESAYRERNGKKILSFKPDIAPISVAVFPLVSKDELKDIALELLRKIRARGIYAIYDEKDSIGRRYARVDEIGVPFAITVDFDTLKDSTVTVRFRDTTEQVRISTAEVVDVVEELVNGKIKFEELKMKK